MIKQLFYTLAIIMLLMSCDKQQISDSSEKNAIFKYKNPIKEGLQVGIRDAQVFQDDDGKYYLMGTSHPFWPRGYEIGYATAKKPLGPWTKYKGNPIYGAQNEKAGKRYGSVFSGNSNSVWQAVGHNEVFEDPDGRL